ncbi:carboxylating nicotinate-nucleotide diphosphorylase [Mesoterricola sediminis]|uniref:Probable nicotinate-nucleotide pyrophosphorylase [carboxylating] n=1 Tax=Mesoterricola sediminis TaxID=2927980 RepID=A0AA48H4D7_9BACT|nr:carboxylating nicotinate-nucleotide diphosphorylase [Mesoterricola sediminis]BDU77236.1 nicotinate-nucleotide diphosphorylase (carboxylating) [Mesoterricola sediminis]
MHNPPHPLTYLDALKAFLREDWGTQDWTTAAVPDRPMAARVVAKQDLTVAGLPVAREVLLAVDPALRVDLPARDGDRLRPGDEALRIEGSSRAILMAERVMLNLLQRLSGTATLTRAFADAVAGTGARILDTRKTTPGLKVLEKYAVRCGGGFNHRLTLGDGILIKENHIAAAGGIGPAVARARAVAPSLVRIEVEAETLDQVAEAMGIPEVDGILLDNMSVDRMAEAVALRIAQGSRVFLEASGNMSLERARPVAETGVDYLSVGALTHSAPAADLSLRF